jgi:hypothetical protein
MRLCLLAAAALLGLFPGCGGGPRFVPVSGVVTLNGKPYDKAAVSFQPIGTSDNPYPGRGSSAYTDENGKFVLTSDNHRGAVVGKHLIRITTRGATPVSAGEPGIGSSDAAPANRSGDPIPLEWNWQSAKEFEVPPGGTDKANFDIVTKQK